MTGVHSPAEERPGTGPARTPRRAIRVAARVAVDFGLPLAVYYALRVVGVGVYLALIVGTLVSAVPATVTLIRNRRVDGMSAYMTTMMLGSLGVSLLSGSTRFLLAKGALLTGVTGVWFIASLWARRPLAYLFSRPLIEGRFRWPAHWDQLWDRYPRFRRMWRVSSAVWGIGTLTDAVLRVVMAYTLPPDLVPALGTALYAGTSAVLLVVTNVYYVVAGVHNPASALYRVPEATRSNARTTPSPVRRECASKRADPATAATPAGSLREGRVRRRPG